MSIQFHWFGWQNKMQMQMDTIVSCITCFIHWNRHSHTHTYRISIDHIKEINAFSTSINTHKMLNTKAMRLTCATWYLLPLYAQKFFVFPAFLMHYITNYYIFFTVCNMNITYESIKFIRSIQNVSETDSYHKILLAQTNDL